MQTVWSYADIAAYPVSVNVLSDNISDVRTPDKLIDGVNDSVDGRHMWLAPILPNIVCLSLFDWHLLVSVVELSQQSLSCLSLLPLDLLLP